MRRKSANMSKNNNNQKYAGKFAAAASTVSLKISMNE